MSDTVIKVENLGKKYLIRHEKRERYTALRDVMANKFKSFGSKIFSPFTFHRSQSSNSPFTESKENFWALKDVSFEIKKGERVGIIGRNGAGKTTLLKLLSRITEPTTGRITLKGRVASLLEVGTGFHPELTGRENIFLNGAILGMSKVEIKTKFDEIVDFAEIEKFLDTPVKRYSSGMYVRLAFAVAAHLEPEILIVDEVLAVGDAQFQKKCLGKMEDVSAKEGRTVLFVSHNMQAIIALCNSAILLQEGKIVRNGPSQEVSSCYLFEDRNYNSFKEWNNLKPGNNIVKLHHIRAVDKNYNTKDSFYTTEPVGIEMCYEVFEKGHVLWHGYNFHNSDGINIFDSHSVTAELYNLEHPIGKFIATAWIPENLLAEGSILIGCAIFNHIEHKIYFHERNVISITIIDSLDGNSSKGKSPGNFPGIVRPKLNWNIVAVKK
jgi:lipopolysaccharide transport system ATP-binding protein